MTFHIKFFKLLLKNGPNEQNYFLLCQGRFCTKMEMSSHVIFEDTLMLNQFQKFDFEIFRALCQKADLYCEANFNSEPSKRILSLFTCCHFTCLSLHRLQQQLTFRKVGQPHLCSHIYSSLFQFVLQGFIVDAVVVVGFG